MPLPLYSPPTIQPIEPIKPVNAKLWEPVLKKQILSHYTHKKLEDRISQRIWYENVTYPDEIATSLIKARNRATSSSDPKKQ